MYVLVINLFCFYSRLTLHFIGNREKETWSTNTEPAGRPDGQYNLVQCIIVVAKHGK